MTTQSYIATKLISQYNTPIGSFAVPMRKHPSHTELSFLNFE